MLAVSNGFSRAGQIDLAFPLGQAGRRDARRPPASHLNLGDLLLAVVRR